MTDRELAIAFHSKRLAELRLAEHQLESNYRVSHRYATGERLERVRYELVIVEATLRALRESKDSTRSAEAPSVYARRIILNELCRINEEPWRCS